MHHDHSEPVTLKSGCDFKLGWESYDVLTLRRRVVYSSVMRTAPLLTINLLREGIVESSHHAQVTIVDARGHVLASAGDSSAAIFVRSALKPIQALAPLSAGAVERFDLTEKDIAIMCGSHRGTMAHARQVFAMMWRADLEVEHLLCPVKDGSALRYNCSGKHAGMLMAARARGWTLHDYMQRDHPVQELVRSHMTELLRMPAAELLCARDDCGVPTYQLQMNQLAYLYAQLAASTRPDLEMITRAMCHQPEMIGGTGQFDTELMRAENLVSKAGAEGVQCVGRVGEGLGLAIKVIDGSSRAKYALALHLLRQLGWIGITTAEHLSEQFCQVGPYTRLEVVGDLPL